MIMIWTLRLLVPALLGVVYFGACSSQISSQGGVPCIDFHDPNAAAFFNHSAERRPPKEVPNPPSPTLDDDCPPIVTCSDRLPPYFQTVLLYSEDTSGTGIYCTAVWTGNPHILVTAGTCLMDNIKREWHKNFVAYVDEAPAAEGTRIEILSVCTPLWYNVSMLPIRNDYGFLIAKTPSTASFLGTLETVKYFGKNATAVDQPIRNYPQCATSQITSGPTNFTARHKNKHVGRGGAWIVQDQDTGCFGIAGITAEDVAGEVCEKDGALLDVAYVADLQFVKDKSVKLLQSLGISTFANPKSGVAEALVSSELSKGPDEQSNFAAASVVGFLAGVAAAIVGLLIVRTIKKATLHRRGDYTAASSDVL